MVYLNVWLNMWLIETVLIVSLDMPAVIIDSAVKKLKLMRVEISKMGIEALKQHLIAVNQGKVRLYDSPPIYC